MHSVSVFQSIFIHIAIISLKNIVMQYYPYRPTLTVPVIKYCTRCNKQFLAQVEDSICDLPDGSAVAYCDPTVLCPLYDDNQFGWYLNERFMNLSDI